MFDYRQTIVEPALRQEKINLEAVDVEQNGKSREDIEKFVMAKADSYLNQLDK